MAEAVISLGEKFRRWRRNHKHLSQKDFARVLGVSQVTVEKIEQGRRKGSRATFQKFIQLQERHQQWQRSKSSRKASW